MRAHSGLTVVAQLKRWADFGANHNSQAVVWPFLEDEQRLVWAAVLEFDAVPTQE